MLDLDKTAQSTKLKQEMMLDRVLLCVKGQIHKRFIAVNQCVLQRKSFLEIKQTLLRTLRDWKQSVIYLDIILRFNHYRPHSSANLLKISLSEYDRGVPPISRVKQGQTCCESSFLTMFLVNEQIPLEEKKRTIAS